jgi:5'-methylthioadenosine phosphorylase
MTAPRPTGERLALIYGYSLPQGTDPIDGKRIEVDAGGALPVEAIDGDDLVAIPRHGFDRRIPAHLVDHRANIKAVCELGCNRVLALGSAGSLHEDLKVGTLICPEDFYAPEIAPSFYRDPRGHSVPAFDTEWRRIVISAWDSLTDTKVEDGGVYAQTIGPRFETAAEVKVLAEAADMVGMTIAAEAILAGEAALAYAAVCSIDNLANGIDDKRLTLDEYRRGRERTAETVAAGLQYVLPALAKGLPGS